MDVSTGYFASQTVSTLEPGLPVRTYPEGRICQHVPCGTHLSIYNDGNYCGQHQLPRTIWMRGVTIV